MKKIILVTGANKGIGYETVRQLAHQGHTVLLGARNQQRGTTSANILAKEGLDVSFIQLDVTDTGQISNAREVIQDKHGHLDVLINNAAIAVSGDTNLLDHDAEMLLKTMQANAFSILELVAALHPLMSQGGKIINLSSGVGSMTDPVNGWVPVYSCSKSLVNAITRQQAYYLLDKQISVVAMCPGWVQTDMGGADAPRPLSEGADTAVWLATTPTIETGKFYRDRQVIPW